MWKKISELVLEDRCRTIHQFSHMAEISYGFCQEFLTENLNMHDAAEKFVPVLLTLDQR